MKIRLITSVSALACGLALSGAAMAQTAGATDSSTATAFNSTADSNNDSSSWAGFNNNSYTSSDNNSSNDDNSNTDNSSSDVSGFNNNDLSSNDDNSTNTDNSTWADNSSSDDNSSNTDNSSSTQTDNSTWADNSSSDDNSTDISGMNGNALGSYNTRVSDSYNSDSSTHTYNMRMNVSTQELSSNVSDISYTGSADGRRSGDSRSLRTGDASISGSALQGFAGINTASHNSGFGSSAQAATMVSANANVTFQ